MAYHRNKGGLWGAGIGLLALVLGIALMLWMFSTSSEVYINAGSQGKQQLDDALDQAKQAVDKANQHNQPQAANHAATQPAPAKTSGQKLQDGLPRQMPAHDGGLLEEMSK